MFYGKYLCLHWTFQRKNINLKCEINMDEITNVKPIKYIKMSLMMRYKIIHLMMNNCKYLNF
jgi:hypothetical protein